MSICFPTCLKFFWGVLPSTCHSITTTMATEKTQSAAPAGKQKKPQQQKNKQKQKVVPHRDQYQRISFLYQAATHMAADPATDPLARIYAQTMKATAKKSVLRL